MDFPIFIQLLHILKLIVIIIVIISGVFEIRPLFNMSHVILQSRFLTVGITCGAYFRLFCNKVEA